MLLLCHLFRSGLFLQRYFCDPTGVYCMFRMTKCLPSAKSTFKYNIFTYNTALATAAESKSNIWSAEVTKWATLLDKLVSFAIWVRQTSQRDIFSAYRCIAFCIPVCMYVWNKLINEIVSLQLCPPPSPPADKSFNPPIIPKWTLMLRRILFPWTTGHCGCLITAGSPCARLPRPCVIPYVCLWGR